MPHVEIKYTSDLEINMKRLFHSIEQTINHCDATSGQCKSRAYPCKKFMHSHVYVEISLLSKSHRNDAFTNLLIKNLKTTIHPFLNDPCSFSLLVRYTPKSYVTEMHNASSPIEPT